ncbi:metalloregulator ArsR/SmtB family transcription factor [Spongiivirga sp. MCCC 1A20706]|uniref:ArsR/SmtB family transcription factor n=1 Tax=Spongiivirga sp. MCCC 1A20706 TaxID=3160963 RepID=UPI00397783E6
MRRDVFQAIADPVRRDIIELLSKDFLTVNEVAENFEISRPAVSKHLKILNECGVIHIEKAGRERICKISPKELMTVADWLERYRKLWDGKLDNFENYLQELKHKNR